MKLSELLTITSIQDVCWGVLFLSVALLSLIQIAPIEINPWSKIARAIGRAICGDVMDAMEENKADSCRYRILRFDDEIRHNQKHTKEHFDQLMDDITFYEDYCSSHPHYKNNKATLAIGNIKCTYLNCSKEHSFL